jgi:hypothetical protein
MTTSATDQDQSITAIELLIEMELEKASKRKEYSKTLYYKKKSLQKEWKATYGVHVPLKDIRMHQDPETIIAQVLAQKRNKAVAEAKDNVDGKRDVCLRLSKGRILIDFQATTTTGIEPECWSAAVQRCRAPGLSEAAAGSGFSDHVDGCPTAHQRRTQAQDTQTERHGLE